MVIKSVVLSLMMLLNFVCQYHIEISNLLQNPEYNFVLFLQLDSL